MGLEQEKERLCVDNQWNRAQWDEIYQIISQQIATKTADEWNQHVFSLNLMI